MSFSGTTRFFGMLVILCEAATSCAILVAEAPVGRGAKAYAMPDSRPIVATHERIAIDNLRDIITIFRKEVSGGINYQIS